MALPQVADGEGFLMCRVAGNILRKQQRTTDKGGLPASGRAGN